MPEASKEVSITLELEDETLHKLVDLKEGETLKTDGITATRKGKNVSIEFTQEVTVEFDLSDYAPDWDEP